MGIRNTAGAAFAIVTGLSASAGIAAEQRDADTHALPAIAGPADAKASTLAASDPLLGAPLANARLATQRGGQDLIVNEQKLKATLTDNSARNLNTGNNIITEGALAGINGIPMVIQNSGNNVIIQNSTILNLNLK